jgi:hypothetical protein
MMQDTPEDVSCERSDFSGLPAFRKGILNGVNDLSFLFGTKEIVQASENGDIAEGHGPSHFLNQRNIRLPLQEGT